MLYGVTMIEVSEHALVIANARCNLVVDKLELHIALFCNGYYVFTGSLIFPTL